MKVEIDGLVREGGKLVTEAELIHALDLSPVREAVILLLGFPVDSVPQGVLHIAVNVIVTTSDNLTTTETHTVCCYQRLSTSTNGRPGADTDFIAIFPLN